MSREDYCPCEDCQEHRMDRVRGDRDRALARGDALAKALRHAVTAMETDIEPARYWAEVERAKAALQTYGVHP